MYLLAKRRLFYRILSIEKWMISVISAGGSSLLHALAILFAIRQKVNQESHSVTVSTNTGTLTDDQKWNGETYSSTAVSPVREKCWLSEDRKDNPVHANDDDTGLGIDMVGGNTVQSVYDGEVMRVGFEKGGYGNFIAIKQSDGFVAYYAHLEKRHDFEVDTSIKAGDVLGAMGDNGKSYGTHLYFEIREPILNENRDRIGYKKPSSLDPIQCLEQKGIKMDFKPPSVTIIVKPLPTGI